MGKEKDSKKSKSKPDYTSKSGKEINHRKGEGIAGTKEDARRKESPYYLAQQGRPSLRRKIKTGDEMWNWAIRYFGHVDDSPMKETKVFGTGIQVDLDLQIPYTISGFCAFVGIPENLLTRYCKLDENEDATEEEKDLALVSRHIKRVIYTQKIEGASAGKFNHQIVALELGLAAKVKKEVVKHDSSKMTEEEIKKYNNQLEGDY